MSDGQLRVEEVLFIVIQEVFQFKLLEGGWVSWRVVLKLTIPITDYTNEKIQATC